MMMLLKMLEFKVRKMAKIRNRYNQAPQLAQDTNGKVTASKLDITGQPFPSQVIQHPNMS